MAKPYITLGAHNMCEQWIKEGKNAIKGTRLCCANYKISVSSTPFDSDTSNQGRGPKNAGDDVAVDL